MAEPRAASEHHPTSLWKTGARKRPRGVAANLAIGLSIAVHAGLIYYIYETKFVTHYREYSDEALTAVLVPMVKPPPPPPEPAEPPPVVREPPPVRELTPHIAPPVNPGLAVATITIPTPEPLPPPAPTVAPEPAMPPAPRLIANPDWSSRPNGEDMARYYPERAQRLEQPGKVTLQCQVTAKGTVAACSILAEDPASFGFGEAALKLSRLFKMKPKMEDGQAVEGAMVKIPIAFRIG